MTVDTEKKETKSTKEVILDYLKQNHGREIAVSEIADTFKYKLNRISNAIKELEFLGEINIERRPLKKGKYTVISLRGDIITQFATHERAIDSDSKPASVSYSSDELPIDETIEMLNSPNYIQSKFSEMIEPYYDNYFSLIIDIIQPLLYETGKMWEEEKITVAGEHVISARLEKFIIDLISKESRRNKDKIIILAPVENEFHTIPLLTLELLLIERGFNVINLARSIPILSIIDFIKGMKKKPDWVFFSLTLDSYIKNLAIDVKLIKDKIPELKVAIGGQGTKNIEEGDFTSVDAIVKDNIDLQNLFFKL